MWPRRKILLLVPRGTEEWQGVVSLFKTLNIDIIVKETAPGSKADLGELTYPGWERDFGDYSEDRPTEILYWSGIPEQDEYRQWGLSQNLSQTEVSDFLLKYWEQEIIIPVDFSGFQHNGFPLLYNLLQGAGFEPSILWKNNEGKWYVEIGRGIHWIVAKEWLEKCGIKDRVGREPERFYGNSYWILQEDRVDFYQDQESYFYLGSLERFLDNCEEKVIIDTALNALQLGVPLRDIRITLAPVANHNNVHAFGVDTNSRRRMNETEGDKGQSREKLSLEPFEYMENRRSS